MLRKLLLLIGFLFSTYPGWANQPGRVVVDMAGREVLIPREVKRVITAGGTPAVNAFIFALGKGETIQNGLPLAMRQQRWRFQTIFAPSQATAPVVSVSAEGVWSPNLERLSSIPHDLVFMDSEQTAGLLAKKGFTVVCVNWKAPDFLHKTLVLLGEIFDRQEQAALVEQYYRSNMARVARRIQDIPLDRRPSALFLKAHPPTLTMVPTTRHLITLAGGRYPASSVAPMSMPISIEQLQLWDPDVLLVGESSEAEKLLREPVFSQLKAVKARRIYVVPLGAHLWSHYTPEQSLAILWLAKLLYPDRFEAIHLADEMKSFYGKFFGHRLNDAEVIEILTQQRR